MDAAYFREKAAICLRLANGLSWNNPSRSELLDLAEDFDRRAQELEAHPTSLPGPNPSDGNDTS
jgi:hypothetical protein